MGARCPDYKSSADQTKYGHMHDYLVWNPCFLDVGDPYFPWVQHPFGRLAQNLVEQYRKIGMFLPGHNSSIHLVSAGDIQTTALLSCVFNFPASQGTTKITSCFNNTFLYCR